jgi:CRP-like cAMP-binding protein
MNSALKLRRSPQANSLHLREDVDVTGSPNLLSALNDEEFSSLRATSSVQQIPVGTLAFRQGDDHDGIFIILSGQMRIYYSGPSGREITLAYWSPGNFIGGPEVFGGSRHMWSGVASRPTELMAVRGKELRRMAERSPTLALALVDALVQKGKCFSALIHMLGTRSAAARLAQLLVLMAELDGRRHDGTITIGRTLTFEDLAKMVGATRQWISLTLERFHEAGLVDVTAQRILIRDEYRLRQFAQ